MLDEILNKIDFIQFPDETIVWTINEQRLTWLRELVSQCFGSFESIHLTSEGAIQRIMLSIQSHFAETRRGGVGDRGDYIYAFAVLVCLMELRKQFPFREMDDIILSLLNSEKISFRTASGLTLLAAGDLEVKIDETGLERSIENGAFFQFPIEYYFNILEQLHRREDICENAAELINQHYENETLDFKVGNYKLFRFLETAIFLASSGYITQHVLMYLIYLAEENVQNEVESIYVRRIHRLLVKLIETNPTGRKSIISYMVEAAPGTRMCEFNNLFKAWEAINWKRADPQVLDDFLTLPVQLNGLYYSETTQIIILTLNVPHLNPKTYEWITGYLNSQVESNLKPDVWGGAEFLFSLLKSMGEMVKEESICELLFLLAQDGGNIHVRYYALCILNYYQLQPNRVQEILKGERIKTFEYLRTKPLERGEAYEMLMAGEFGKNREITEEDVDRYMESHLTYW